MWNKVVFVWMFIYLQYWVELSNITFYVVCKNVAIVNWCSFCVFIQQIFIVLFFANFYAILLFLHQIDMWYLLLHWIKIDASNNEIIIKGLWWNIDGISMFQYQQILIDIDKSTNGTSVASNMSFFFNQQTFSQCSYKKHFDNLLYNIQLEYIVRKIFVMIFLSKYIISFITK